MTSNPTERKPPNSTSIGKRIRIAGVDREVFRGPRGGYFFINSKGNRIDLIRRHREEVFLEAPVVNECTTSANGTSTGKRIVIRGGVDREVFQGRHGGYFYMNCKGTRTFLIPQHREKLGLEVPAVYECTTSANGTSTGKRIVIRGGVDREVFRGCRGGYFYINCRGTRINLIRQQREKLGLTKKG